ncbi:MAG: hypothetical protein KDA41_21035, partial [Planctomycetales bacterium]|nr:hypothetical protein [Planctomycetales bacterium]
AAIEQVLGIAALSAEWRADFERLLKSADGDAAHA